MKNKIIIITGAASGIGKALATRCAMQGARLSLADLNAEQLEHTETELKKWNAEILVVPTDVSIEADCKALIAKTVERYGVLMS